MSPLYEIHYLQALAMTVITETGFLFLFLRYGYKIPSSTLQTSMIVFGGLVSSSVTLPHIWFILPAFISDGQIYPYVAESFAVVAETWIIFFLFKLSLPKSFLLALLCNMSSFVAGKMIGM